MWQSSYGQAVKSIRKTRLKRADDLVNTAEDNGIDSKPFRQYRQWLRDIPETFDNPEDVVWRQEPALPQPSA